MIWLLAMGVIWLLLGAAWCVMFYRLKLRYEPDSSGRHRPAPLFGMLDVKGEPDREETPRHALMN